MCFFSFSCEQDFLASFEAKKDPTLEASSSSSPHIHLWAGKKPHGANTEKLLAHVLVVVFFAGNHIPLPYTAGAPS